MALISRQDPLYMDNIQETYLLQRGTVHIFIVPISDGHYGRRFYIKSVQPEETFCGGRVTLAGRDFIMLAVPVQAAAEIEKLPLTLNPDEMISRQSILAEYAGYYIEFHDREKEISLKQERNEAYETHNTLHKFLKISDPDGEKNRKEPPSDDPLYEAARLVCKSGSIHLISREELAHFEDAGEGIDFLAKASQFNIRQVLLEGNWWKDDNGALLGYMKDDKRPVALIPQKPGAYMLHDVSRGEIQKMSGKLAEQIEPQALMFYRPFPNKALTLLDLLKLGVRDCWRRDIATVLIMALIGALIGLLVPKVTKELIDVYIPGGEKDQLLQIGLLFIAFLIGKGLYQLIRDLAMLRIEGKMEGSLQPAVWDRLLSLPVKFFKDYTSGELAMRAFGIAQIRQMVSGVLISTVITGVFSLVYLFQVFSYGEDLAGPAVIMLLILLVLGYLMGRIQMKYEKEFLTLTNKTGGLVLQLFNAVAKFRVAGAENRAFKQWADLFTDSRRINFRKEMITSIANTVMAVAPLIFSLVFYIKEVDLETSLQVGAFVAFTTAFGSLSQGMMSTIQTIIQINAIKPMYEMCKPILETLPEANEMKSNPGKLGGNIRVSHVSFRYTEEGPLILQDVSLDIPSGEYVAIVGPSGSGKSTLFRILLGFETPESGQVYYDDQDIARLDIRSIRRQLGVVLQNGQLMSGDIFTNIIGSNTRLTMKDARRAAEMAGLMEDIDRMPMGMNTVISEGAGTISGGQKQRILIARAIVHNPRILYFDEATSALDNKTQKKISESLKSLNCTRVIIAHRLSTVTNCDRIIVMDKGRIVEMGSYDELMKNEAGIFAALAKRQLA